VPHPARGCDGHIGAAPNAFHFVTMTARSLHGRPDRRLSSPARRARVLVVDDDPNTRKLVVEALARGADVVGRTKPSEALALLEATPVDALVLDLILLGTDSNGLELLRCLPEDRRPGRIVVLTGWHAAAATARELGAHEVLAKPCSTRELRDAMVTARGVLRRDA
jgi:two-component system OmpR family response regulator